MLQSFLRGIHFSRSWYNSWHGLAESWC